MTALEALKTSYVEPSPMSKTSSDNVQKTSVASFSNVNSVTLNEGSTSMDINKFMMKDNTYTENYSGMLNAINYLRNIRAIYMENESYKDNSGHFAEALSTYGSIPTASTNFDVYYPPGALSFSFYFLTNSGISQVTEAERYIYYPGSPIIIDGALLVSINTITFDNNYKQEVSTNNNYDAAQPSQSISFTRCNGKVTITGMTVKNLKGLDGTKIKTLLGTGASNLLQFNPNQRSTANGNVLATVTDPKYAMDYGFK